MSNVQIIQLIYNITNGIIEPKLIEYCCIEYYLCCNATSPQQTICAISKLVGHSPVPIAPKTPHSCVSPDVTAPRPFLRLTPMLSIAQARSSSSVSWLYLQILSAIVRTPLANDYLLDAAATITFL